MADERNDVADLMRGPEGAKAADYANYFSSYAYLYHQKQMLSDGARMAAYRTAILGNARVFSGKTVLDVGAGSGILSIWAAEAGASKVYAVEFTSMATHAARLVAANGWSHVVEVRRCAVEELEEGIEVDIIVSEWMGYFLLRESMLDSVLYARDHFLKETGAIFPNRANLYWAPISASNERDAKLREKVDAMADFDSFAGEMKTQYGVSVDCLREAYDTEQADYYLKQAQWCELQDDHLLAPAAKLASFDLYTCSIPEARGVEGVHFDFPVPLTDIDGFAGWFDVSFDSTRDGTRLDRPQILCTSPSQGYTHWGQQVFFVVPTDDDHLYHSTAGTFSLTRQINAIRLYNVRLSLTAPPCASKHLFWELS